LTIILFLLDLSLIPFPYFINSQHPCYSLNTKIRPMFCCTPWILVSVPTSNRLEIFHPWLRHWSSKTMVYQLSVEENNNPTNTIFQKRKQPLHTIVRIHHPLILIKHAASGFTLHIKAPWFTKSTRKPSIRSNYIQPKVWSNIHSSKECQNTAS